MKVNRLQAGIYATNCYVLETGNNEAVIVDPGGEGKAIAEWIKEKGLHPKAILLTHGHGDHIGGVLELKDIFSIPVYIHRHDEDMIKSSSINLSSEMPGKSTEIKADKILEDGQELNFGSTTLRVIHTPGHTRGGVCFYTIGTLISGDTLFQGSIGRTDLFGGDYDTLMSSIVSKLMILPDETIVYPGHGASTSIKDEKTRNPFVKEALRKE